MKLSTPEGATPLDDTEGLIPSHITTRQELDDLEFANINNASKKYFLRKLNEKNAPFDVAWLIKVHKEMYGEVWNWAGAFRKTELNIGTTPSQIAEQLKQLMDDLRYWRDETRMDIVEITARLHHGLVKIHPFKNGNGRWARFIANIHLRREKISAILWPEETLQVDSPFRKRYIDALRQADRNDFSELFRLHRELINLYS